MPGPPPKSATQRRAEGDASKRKPTGKRQPPPRVRASFDSPPVDLEGDLDAQEEWRRIVPVLRNRGSISVVDRAVLMAYCLTFGSWIRARKRIMANGSHFETSTGYLALSPDAIVERNDKHSMVKLLQELGMTPASRARITIDPTSAPDIPEEEAPDEQDVRFDQMFVGRRATKPMRLVGKPERPAPAVEVESEDE